MQTQIIDNLSTNTHLLHNYASLHSILPSKHKVQREIPLPKYIVIKDGLIDGWIRRHSLRNNQLLNDEPCVFLPQAKWYKLQIVWVVKQQQRVLNQGCDYNILSTITVSLSEMISKIKQTFFQDYLNSISNIYRIKSQESNSKLKQNYMKYGYLEDIVQQTNNTGEQPHNYQQYQYIQTAFDSNESEQSTNSDQTHCK